MIKFKSLKKINAISPLPTAVNFQSQSTLLIVVQNIMKTNLSFLLILSFMTGLDASPQDDNTRSGAEAEIRELGDRVERVAEEITRRRQIRAEMNIHRQIDPVNDGAVYQPSSRIDSSMEFKVVGGISIVNEPLGIAAREYALYRQTEVMVSSKVSKVKLSVRVDSREASNIEIARAFEHEFSKLGVRVVEVSSDLVVLAK